MHRKAKQGRSKVKLCPDAVLPSTEDDRVAASFVKGRLWV